MNVKALLRSTLIFLRLDLTRNLRYDRLSKLVFRQAINNNSHCIDVGCHKGELLKMICHLAPEGSHYAFEPIPHLYDALKQSFPQVAVFPYALGNAQGSSSFQFVRNAPAYSGIRQRSYKVENPDIDVIDVEQRRLDDLIPVGEHIDFIKIDVEGGEFDVLKGAERILIDSKPVLLFEFGLGASDYYGSDPADLHDYLCNCGLRIFTLQGWLKNRNGLTREDFVRIYAENREYYFVAGV
jgi:FkbM family methyltransferase